MNETVSPIKVNLSIVTCVLSSINVFGLITILTSLQYLFGYIFISLQY